MFLIGRSFQNYLANPQILYPHCHLLVVKKMSPVQLDLFYKIAIVCLSTLGLFGGIPSIKKALERKSDLRVKKAVYTWHRTFKRKAIAELNFELRNDGRIMATDVKCRWTIVQKDTNLQVQDSVGRTEDVGYIAPLSPKEFLTSCSLLDLNNDYYIWVWLSCSQKVFNPVKLVLQIEEE